MRTLHQRIAGAESSQIAYITYTDASFENGNGGIADAPTGPLSKKQPGVCRVGYVTRDTSILPSGRGLSAALQISGAELSAPPIGVPPPQLRAFFMGGGLSLYGDSDAVPCGTVQGPTRIASARRYATVFGGPLLCFRFGSGLGYPRRSLLACVTHRY